MLLLQSSKVSIRKIKERLREAFRLKENKETLQQTLNCSYESFCYKGHNGELMRSEEERVAMHSLQLPPVDVYLVVMQENFL